MASNGCCLEWEQEVILYLDHELSGERCERIESHLKKCEGCRAFSHDMQREELLLAGKIKHEAESSEPGLAFTDTIMIALPDTTSRRVSWRLTETGMTMWNAVFSEGRWHAAVAASILVCVLGTLAAFHVGDAETEKLIAIKRNGASYPARMHEDFFVSNPKGEFFEFPDGSVVYATEGTWFVIDSYPKASNEETIGIDRKLELKWGELFLSVTPSNEGFSVLNANSETKVFGTQFYVAINKGKNKYSTVAVREGQVMVMTRDNTRYTILQDLKYTRVIGSMDTRIFMDVPKYISADMRQRLNRFNDALEKGNFESYEPEPGLYEPDATTTITVEE